MRLAAAVLPLIAATACTTQPATEAAPSQAATTAPAPKTADDVAKALKAHGLPVQAITVFDENTDPNHFLGRPGGYASKVNFTDPAVQGTKRAEGGNDVAHGGSIEMFDDPADALKRGQFIQTFTEGMRLIGREYGYISGGVLLRLTGSLLPSRAAQYSKALTDITGKPVTVPKAERTP